MLLWAQLETITADCAYSHTELPATTHSTTAAGRVGNARKYAWAAAEPTTRTAGTDGRSGATGFVDSTGEATSRSEADGLAQEGGKARAGPAGSVEERAGHVA